MCVLQIADLQKYTMEVHRRLRQYHFFGECGARESSARLALNRESWRPGQGVSCLERAEAGARATGPPGSRAESVWPKSATQLWWLEGAPKSGRKVFEKPKNSGQSLAAVSGREGRGTPIYTPPSAPCQATAPPCLVHGDNSFDAAFRHNLEFLKDSRTTLPDRAVFFINPGLPILPPPHLHRR